MGLLKQREQQILDLVCQRVGYAKAAKQLGISLSTFKTHLYNLCNRVGVTSREALIDWAIDTGLAQPESALRTLLPTEAIPYHYQAADKLCQLLATYNQTHWPTELKTQYRVWDRLRVY